MPDRVCDAAKKSAAADPVRLEVFHHLFASAAEEMGASLMRSAFSPNIKERRDFSCALFDAEGRCISVDHAAHARTRNMPACMATGQAAGVAAAVALDAGTTVREAPVARIQAILRAVKMPLHCNQIN